MKSAKELQKELTFSVEHISRSNPEMQAKAFEFCEGYKDFLSASKTERETVKNMIEMAKAEGYEEYNPEKIEAFKAATDKNYQKNDRIKSNGSNYSRGINKYNKNDFKKGKKR